MKILKHTYFLIGLSLLLLLPNLLSKPKVSLVKHGHPWESFEPQLVLKLSSVNDVLVFTDSVAKEKGTDSTQLAWANELSEVIKNRFYHGYSYYSIQENWVASVSGSLFWSHLSAIVLPDDVLKYPNAACSQQSIVLMECFRRKGIPFRKVGYDHHYALEGEIDGKWYYFDPNLEPVFDKVSRKSIDTIFIMQEEYAIYNNRLDSATVQWGLANRTIGEVNAAPAPQASLFHRATKVLSKTLWLLPLGLVFYFRRRKKFTSSRVHGLTS